jgi:hypothetical protein
LFTKEPDIDKVIGVIYALIPFDKRNPTFPPIVILEDVFVTEPPDQIIGITLAVRP